MRSINTALAAAVTLAVAAPASAQLGRESERIRTAVEAGRIAPIGELVQRAAPEQPVVVIEAELEEESDAPSGWIYEVEILTEDGTREFEIDAQSGEILDD